MACCAGPGRFAIRGVDDTYSLQRIKCSRPTQRVLTALPAVSYIPPHFHRYVQPRLNDHDVRNHVVQARRHAPSKNKHGDGCGCIIRYNVGRCVSDDIHQGSGLNPTCASQHWRERARVIALSTRSQDWCNTRDSSICAYRDFCPIKHMCPVKATCANRKLGHGFKATTCSIKMMCQFGQDTCAASDKPTTQADYTCSKSKAENERAYNVSFWLQALLDEMNHLRAENANLEEREQAMVQCFHETDLPLESATLVQKAHHSRALHDPSRPNDELDDSLCQERTNLYQSREILDNMIARANAQIGRNRKALEAMERDYAERTQLDPIESCHFDQAIKVNSTRMGFHPGIRYTNQIVDAPEHWIKGVRRDVHTSRVERGRSEKLCKVLEYTMSASINEIWHHANVTNVALQHGIERNERDRTELKQERDEVLHELDILDRRIILIRRSLEEFETSSFMQRTVERQRAHNLSEDVCNHIVVDLLSKDVKTHCETIGQLKSKLAKAEQDRRDLVQRCNDIGQLIGVKKVDFNLDVDVCVPLRNAVDLKLIDAPVVDHKLHMGPDHC